MQDPAIEKHLPLHPDTFRILSILTTGQYHGYAIVKRMEQDPARSGKVLPANLYRRIRTLLDQGLIRETNQRPDPDLDDERRRYFEVTDLGIVVARAEAARLRALLDGAGDLIVS